MKYYGLIMPSVFPTGVFIQDIKQTASSDESEGINTITITLTNRLKAYFHVKNGKQGSSAEATAQMEQHAEEFIASELAAQKAALEQAIEQAKIALHNSAIQADTVLKQTAEAKKQELAALITAAENALQGKVTEAESYINAQLSAASEGIDNKIKTKIEEKFNETTDMFIKLSGAIGEIRYFTSKNYTYGYLYANGYSFIPDLYPDFYQFWLENFGDKKKKNYLGYDTFGYPKLPDLRGVSLRAVDDGANKSGVSQALEYQHDAIRNITGEFPIQIRRAPKWTNGAFYVPSWDTGDSDGSQGGRDFVGRYFGFDASRVVPTAEDNRVKSYGVYPFIKVI